MSIATGSAVAWGIAVASGMGAAVGVACGAQAARAKIATNNTVKIVTDFISFSLCIIFCITYIDIIMDKLKISRFCTIFV
jgi:hypothetical protein